VADTARTSSQDSFPAQPRIQVPLRLAVIAEQLLSPVPGGTGRYTRELTTALLSLTPAGDQLAVWTAWHRDLREARFGSVLPHRLPLTRRALAASWEWGLGPAPSSAGVVHAMTLLVPPRRRNTKLVVTIHDAVPWTHPETLTPRGVRWHRKMAERAVQEADAIVTPSVAVAEELVNFLDGLEPPRVHALGAGSTPSLQISRPEEEVRAVRDRLGLPERYLLSLSTLEPRKGLDVTLDALAQLSGAPVPLAVVGPGGWGGIDLAAEVRRRRIAAEDVLVLGRVPDSELAAVLAGALALVAPSRAEGFGLPVLEAMSAGVPVICSDVPALVEVGGDAALVVPRGDPCALAAAIDLIRDDSRLRQTMIAAGIERARAFDWTDVASRAWALYHGLP
jgi:glycosyltransferase involved in cell wall biosynthesis